MPHYEVTLLVKALAKKELIEVIGRCTSVLLNQGAVVTKMQSLGLRDLPLRYNQGKDRHYTANYMLLDCFMPLNVMLEALDEFKRDTDLLRFNFEKIEKDTQKFEFKNVEKEPGVFEIEKIPKKHECTLSEELLPPSYRPSVQELRKTQRMAHYTRVIAHYQAIQAYRKHPKSFTVYPRQNE